MKRIDLRRLVRTALVITIVWQLAGVFFAVQHHTAAIGRGEPDSLSDRLMVMAMSMFARALVTPVLLMASERLPLYGPRRWRNALRLLPLALFLALLLGSLDTAMPSLLGEEALDPRTFWEFAFSLSHTHLLFNALILGVANFLALEQEELARRRAEARLESELAAARLRQLSADLHPHFLFNALNAVAALLHDDPAAAEEMLGKLKELLRASVESEQEREVPLSAELAFVDRYFDIQKMRYGDKLRTAIHVAEAELENAAIPPLLLQPLVENAIIHGITRRREGGSVEIVVDRERGLACDWLRLEVRDDGPGSDPEKIFGRNSVGVPNAVARLASIYGERQSLRYLRRDGSFIAEIRIPLRKVAA
ncbi:MAG: histidine kinase [Acidobacteriota bacterium]|nr:histidine kinase [Acidobacteriota bacterium]